MQYCRSVPSEKYEVVDPRLAVLLVLVDLQGQVLEDLWVHLCSFDLDCPLELCERCAKQLVTNHEELGCRHYSN